MQAFIALIALGVALALGACASEDNKEWMKLDGRATEADLKRDYTACSKSGKLDEECMRSRGWLAVSPGVTVQKAVAPAQPGPPSGISNR
jgi:hypothetical protein